MVIGRAPTGSYPPISEYGLIGDCHSAALISASGSVDWWCPDRFDGPSIFGALLDRRRGGRFRVRPFGLNWSAQQRYLPGTNVLETAFTTLQGRARVLDFAPVSIDGPRHLRSEDRGLVRLIEGLTGSVTVEISFDPRFDYGRDVPVLHTLPDGVSAASSSGYARLRCTVAADFEAGRARITVSARGRVGLVCTTGIASEKEPSIEPWEALEDTTAYWSNLAERCTYVGRYRTWVERSALGLMLMTHAPTGSCVSSPTTSLPYAIPGELNWDERYVTLSDGAAVAAALKRCGYADEAGKLAGWLGEAASRSLREGDLKQEFTVDGGRPPPVRALEWLEGYEGCRPVRHGSSAQIASLAAMEAMVANVASADGADTSALNSVAALMQALVDRDPVPTQAGTGAMSAVAVARLVNLGVLRGRDAETSLARDSGNGRSASTPESPARADGGFLRAAFPLVAEFRDSDRPADAVRLFEHLLGYSGSQGLLPSEADPYTGRALGNHPHAAMHAAVIEGAYSLQDL